MKYAFVLAASLLALGACASGGGFHDSVKLQAAGIGFNPTTGVTAGYLGATIDRSQNVDKEGHAITVPGCNGRGSDTPDTFANLNSKAQASASNTTSPIPAAAAAAAAAGVVSAPQIAWASGDTSANGAAALVAAAAGTPVPADTIAAICDNHELPTAPPSSIVRAGVAPK